MKKNACSKMIYALAASCALWLTAPSSATILASDDFSYADGALAGQSGGTGWAGEWFGNGNVAASSAVTLPEDPAYRQLNSLISHTAGTSVYAAFDIATPIDVPLTYIGLSFLNEFGGEEVFIGKTYFESSFGIDWTGYGAIASGSLATSARLVAEFMFGAVSTTINLYIDPTGYASTAAVSFTADTASLGDNWGYVRLASGGPNDPIQGTFDNLVIATDKTQVGIPEPSSLLMFLFTPLLLLAKRKRA